MSPTLLSCILELSVEERIKLAGAIWESISQVPEALTLNEAQREELDRRIEAYLKDPNEGSSWEEIRSRILSRK